jgi:hypothetical protein
MATDKYAYLKKKPGPNLAGPKAKLDRAAEHLQALNKEMRTFRERRSYSIGSHTDPDSGNYFLYASPRQIPAKLSAIVGDVLCNLRPALDHLVFALAQLDSGKAQDRTQFPICDSPKHFKRKRDTWLKGLSPDHITAIERLQPYPGRDSNAWLAVLRDLSNPDKHQELSVLISDIGGDFEILKKPLRVVKRKDAKPPSSDSIARLVEKLAERSEPQAKKEITFSIPPDHKLANADVYVQVGLRFDIAFENGLPVVELLKLLHAETAALLKTFEPEFKRA